MLLHYFVEIETLKM